MENTIENIHTDIYIQIDTGVKDLWMGKLS